MSSEGSTARSRTFRLGLNYWPARTAMGWWQSFEGAEVRDDFARISAAGFDSVRLFLTWEHFQPRPDQVDSQALARLVSTLDLAHEAGLVVMPTLFTGHMSGVNWIPGWALGGGARDERFRVVSEGRVRSAGLRNWYADPEIARAQAKLATVVAHSLAEHPALWAWDLGNENSNCVIPPTKAHAQDWLRRMSDAIRENDPGARITLGIHMEDLEQDRNLGPTEAAEVCDFLTMHGYPGYAAWARGPTDEDLLPFLAQLTAWLGDGAEVVFSEFGLPTLRSGDAESQRVRAACSTALVEEQVASDYVERALAALYQCGCSGAMLWCHADYVPATWQTPPLDCAVHERFFGQWRADGSPKPALAKVEAFAKRRPLPPAPRAASTWLDIDPEAFYANGVSDLPRLYQRYLEAMGS
ncbi:MAG TPA: cellulase family glycosylhydrolase [Polyangiaceae bacterium]|nr:cellulase family glycosylhydrolase [Polyangiaceae bacterium]